MIFDNWVVILDHYCGRGNIQFLLSLLTSSKLSFLIMILLWFIGRIERAMFTRFCKMFAPIISQNFPERNTGRSSRKNHFAGNYSITGYVRVTTCEIFLVISFCKWVNKRIFFSLLIKSTSIFTFGLNEFLSVLFFISNILN